MFEEILNYAKSIGNNEEVLAWLNTTGKKHLGKSIDASELEHVIDYMYSSAAPNRLKKMAIHDAKRKAKEWQESNIKKGRELEDLVGDIEVVHDFEDGSMIVKLLTENAYKREGFLMSHCLGGYNVSQKDCDIYSYRDEKNYPHATFEVRKNCKEIVQIKGKGNGSVHPKYVEPVLIFLEILGLKVRTSEMKNLGYYHIDKSHVDFLKKDPKTEKQLVEVRGEYYAV